MIYFTCVHSVLSAGCSTQTSVLEALLNDVRAHQLKGAVGSGPANGSTPKQLYTSQMLCNVVTLEQVAAIKRADVRTELVPKVSETYSLHLALACTTFVYHHQLAATCLFTIALVLWGQMPDTMCSRQRACQWQHPKAAVHFSDAVQRGHSGASGGNQAR
jgi:hypothetical protein